MSDYFDLESEKNFMWNVQIGLSPKWRRRLGDGDLGTGTWGRGRGDGDAGTGTREDARTGTIYAGSGTSKINK